MPWSENYFNIIQNSDVTPVFIVFDLMISGFGNPDKKLPAFQKISKMFDFLPVLANLPNFTPDIYDFKSFGLNFKIVRVSLEYGTST